ncbi:hypothetical protein ColLi_06130 [Colletotrichum liriopes]|uniref:Uncharacterized protein n=1 Tax=Colletotrichum liriopes TaxID=708192 RepID=A0AA37LSZ7_9PEZI|nr:hypothetical protein ColLi_06130 [Colletotrichum liriopes]
MKTTTTRAVLLTLLSSCSFTAGVRAAANLCFFPGGIQARDVPCDPKAEVSMCCGSVNACLSNGLCKLEDTSNNTGIANPDPDTRRNSSAFDFRFNGVQVWQCDSQGFGVPGKFCCESAAEKTRCCSTPAAVFGPLIAATPGNAAAVQTFNSGAQSSPTPSGSGQSSGVTGTPSQQTPDMTGAPTITSKIPATPGGADASSPTGSGNDDNSDSQDGGQRGIGNVAIVGMGVGASVGGALLVAVGVMWWLRKERQRRGPVELDGSSTHGGGGNGAGSDLSRSNTGRIAYGGMNINNGTGTVSSMGTGTYGMAGIVRRASSDWDGSPGGIGGNYQMAEIDGKETLVVAEPQGRKKSLYELP